MERRRRLRLLLDTHALLWWLLDEPRLGREALAAITEHEVFVSAVSAIEITQKVRVGKLPSAAALAADFRAGIAGERFAELPITVEHAALAGALPIAHKDPFDRLLIAQAQIEQLWLVSNETAFDGFGVRRLW